MSELSPKMQHALSMIDQRAMPVSTIGRNTVEALMRRGLVELDEKMEHVFLPPHKHEWLRDMHMDGCHWFTSVYHCECGARASTRTERSVRSDPYSAVWMEPTSDEPCQRCEQLQKGARPQHVVTLIRARPRPVAA